MYLFRARNPADKWKADALNATLASPLDRLDGDRLRMLLAAFLLMVEHQQRIRQLLQFGAACGDVHDAGDGPVTCIKPTAHEGRHTDGGDEWSGPTCTPGAT